MPKNEGKSASMDWYGMMPEEITAEIAEIWPQGILEAKLEPTGIMIRLQGPGQYSREDQLAIKEVYVRFHDCPLEIHYVRDAPKNIRLIMAGLLETPQGKIREKLKGLEPFKEIVRGRKPAGDDELDHRKEVVDEITRIVKKTRHPLNLVCQDKGISTSTFDRWQKEAMESQ